MAEASSTPKQANKVPNHGDHDRVQMPSVKADGTFDQHNPEFIGDKDVTTAAVKEQFVQQAVSAADVQHAGPTGGTVVSDAPQDPAIEAAKKEHEKVAAAAEKAAVKAVDELHQG